MNYICSSIRMEMVISTSDEPDFPFGTFCEVCDMLHLTLIIMFVLTMFKLSQSSKPAIFKFNSSFIDDNNRC